MRLKHFVLIITLLTFISCSDINKVKTDGTRELNGKTIQTLYVDTDKEIEKLNLNLSRDTETPPKLHRMEVWYGI
jgi:hypothetical protein